MSDLQFHQFTCRQDNFGVLAHDPKSGDTASVDAPQTAAVERALEEKGWRLTHILCTHHHGDHTEGNLALKQAFGVTIVGPASEAGKIPGIDQTCEHGDTIEFAGNRVEVIGTPGHTLGQIAYYFPGAGVAFTGDTLFALGCGRVFEGDANMMWTSLTRLSALPGETIVYCGHEYTLSNARFALTIDPGNKALAERAKEVEALRNAGKPTLPTTIGLEKATNPFLRVADPSIRANLGMQNASDVEVFAEIRARKDRA